MGMESRLTWFLSCFFCFFYEYRDNENLLVRNIIIFSEARLFVYFSAADDDLYLISVVINSSRYPSDVTYTVIPNPPEQSNEREASCFPHIDYALEAGMLEFIINTSSVLYIA